jgi:hypothetical protein
VVVTFAAGDWHRQAELLADARALLGLNAGQERLATARRVHRVTDGCRERGHVVSAREAYLRAANYYRAAEFYLHGDPADQRIHQLSREARSCFRAALVLFQPDVEGFAIPYEGTTLPGYYYPAAAPGCLPPSRGDVGDAPPGTGHRALAGLVVTAGIRLRSGPGERGRGAPLRPRRCLTG